MKRFTSLAFWLPKIPLLSLIGIFLLPVLLIQIHYLTGLFFIALYISYWTIKVFESYYYVLRSYFALLANEKKQHLHTPALQDAAKTIQHIVIIPIYTEPYNVIEEAVQSVIQNEYLYRENITILLATEERAPDAQNHAKALQEKFVQEPIKIINSVHPVGIPGEGKVKGSNITYALRELEKQQPLDPETTFVSTIDTDTKVEKHFFSTVTQIFLETDEPHRAIYQYTPIYSNNWISGTFFARLIAIGTTMWQLFESQNPEFYRNFAVYGQSLLCLKKANYWSLTSIVEDGLQYWRSYFGWNGKFRIVNTPAVCEMDLVDETNLYRTVRSQYKQLRRWSWGCTDVEFVIPKFLEAQDIPLGEKIRKTTYLLYNHLFWAGGPFMLFFIGFIPGINGSIDDSIAVLTVPIAVSIISTLLFATVIFPSLLSIHIMRRYTKFRPQDYFFNLIQWITVPLLTLTLFSIPAIESQVRLFFGKRIDSFDTTQKMARKK
jgi:cellulose synthase/poly-beta-1,6-N-acetylglucosamine synthase-like glycosyltransferase